MENKSKNKPSHIASFLEQGVQKLLDFNMH